MKDETENCPIRPELVARKLECVHNFEHEDVLAEINEEPRLVEVLWFLQWISSGENYPGGIRKFARDLIAESADIIGTATMIGASEPYSADVITAILKQIPERAERVLGVTEISAMCWGDEESEEERQHRVEFNKAARLKRQILGRADMVPVVTEAAEENLAAYLRRLCEGTAIRFRRPAEMGAYANEDGFAPWYFAGVADAILRFMDRRKTAIAGEIAETAVSKEIFRWLDRAVRARDSVIIEGNSRFGKTEAIRAWCRMNPDRARLVETPASNSEGDLLVAVASALGIESARRQPGHYLRRTIEYVLRQSRAMLVFEEAHFLFPWKIHKTSAPARLNWVRRSVMDAGIPVAFICTPQSYHAAQSRFVKATGYPLEQLEGRFLPTVRLPETVPMEDLLAIARKHLPGVREATLGFMVNLLAATERNYCSDVARIARLAFINAEDSGRRTPNVEDIEAAIKEALPQAAKAPAGAGESHGCERPARRVNARCTTRATTAQRRELAPARSVAATNDFEAPQRGESPVILAG